MKKLFEAIKSALVRGESVVLCSILSSSGSAPRGAGAKMAVFADGRTLGTIGGGAVELLATETAREVHRTGTELVKGYRLHKNQIEDIGMICGGDVTVYFQRFTENQLEFVEAALELLEQGENAWLVMGFVEGRVQHMGLYDESKGLRFADFLSEAELRPMLPSQSIYINNENQYYVEQISRTGRVYIFGGGHVGKALASVLAGVDFRVTIFDNRPDFAKSEVFPTADSVIFGDYGHIFEKIAISPEDYAVIMTPGHQADREVLLQVMRTRATYVGCIGSRKKIAATNQYLLENGISEQELGRIHAPIGLPIQAVTPEEIAVSIAAELILHRAKHARGET